LGGSLLIEARSSIILGMGKLLWLNIRRGTTLQGLVIIFALSCMQGINMLVDLFYPLLSSIRVLVELRATAPPAPALLFRRHDADSAVRAAVIVVADCRSGERVSHIPMWRQVKDIAAHSILNDAGRDILSVLLRWIFHAHCNFGVRLIVNHLLSITCDGRISSV
jgi:hypothetical protein